MTIVGNYEIGELLHEDKFSEEHLAKHISTGNTFMCKVIKREIFSDPNKEIKLKREIAVLSKLHHEYINQLVSFYKSKKHFFLFFEYSGNITLADLLKDGPISELPARRYFQQLIESIEYMHSQNISHRDIKPENIFITETNSIKVTNFSIAILVAHSDSMLETICGTPYYAAPEIFEGKPYNGLAVDIWSSIITLYVMLSTKLPFNGSSLAELKAQVLQCKFSFPSHFPEGAQDLIRKVLKIEPSERLTIAQIKEHPWVNQEWHRSKDLTTLQEIQEEEVEENIINAFELIGSVSGLTLSSDLSTNSAQSFILHFPLKNTEKIVLSELKKLGKVQKNRKNHKFIISVSSNPLEIEVSPKELSKTDTIIALNLISGNSNEFSSFVSNLKHACGA